MKFLLDTNVLSAMMTGRGTPKVAAWIAIRSTESLFTASICEAEILAGLAIMPDGRRRSALELSAHAMFAEDFRGRVWAFDAEAARSYAGIFAARRRTGRPIATMDLMIAAIARTRDAVVVTRNVADFLDCGLTIENPWLP
ncbi:type II toxin-antitoxin system VapC family toxin [Methylobacterium sp. Leaf469]|uniref:type II toxin-antitoxin system VapC family toxin n=1 Tax=Methylobacterium sp. Leaf469 TaxID=1736387 RepID=UPI0009EA86EA|nr:type II toxin-antitoxin system VapC family toxin [Methylobacterium sp. Leaf469]